MKYDIVEETDRVQFVALINKALGNGWKFQGDLIISQREVLEEDGPEKEMVYIQAMVRDY